MFTTPLEKILEALGKIKTNGSPVFKTIDAWTGDVKDLLDKVQKFPSAHVLLSVGEFDEPKTLRGEVAPAETTWSIVILSENRSDRKTGFVESLGLIEALLNFAEPAPGQPPFAPDYQTGLVRLNTSQGRLWPAVVQFLAAEGGKSAYGIKFYNKKGY